MKVLKNLSYAALLALFLVGCGGGGGGSADNTGGANNSGTTNTGNTPSGAQDNQNSLAYVNGIYDIEGWITEEKYNTISDKGQTTRKLTITFENGKLNGLFIDKLSSFAVEGATLVSDTGSKTSLNSDGSFNSYRIMKYINNSTKTNMTIDSKENGKFSNDSIQGKFEMTITAENSGVSNTGKQIIDYHSVNKTATH